MKKYFRIIRRFFQASINMMLVYPAETFSDLGVAVYWVILSLVSLSVLSYQVDAIAGWNRYHLFLVQGVYSVLIGLVYGFFMKNFTTTIEEIWQGTFDYKLLKPLDAQFLATVGYIRLRSFVRLSIGVGLIVYSLLALKIAPSLIQIGVFMIMLGCGLVVSYALLVLSVVVALYSPHIFNLADALANLISLSRYPLVIFRVFGDVWIYILLPLVIMSSVPAQVLLGRPDYPLILLSGAFSLIAFVGMRYFWKWSLRHYNSVS